MAYQAHHIFQLKDASEAAVQAAQAKLTKLADAAQYGWGHTMDFGSFTMQGFLDSNYQKILHHFDEWGWVSKDLSGKQVADVGCFTGGMSMMLAERAPDALWAVDELPDHLEQCAQLAALLGHEHVKTLECSSYRLAEHIPEGSLDLIVLSGVLYHMSDMLVGLYSLNKLLKPGGVLLIETNAVDDHKRSYANFGRYHAGMWWQPTSLCVKDMCEFMGFEDVQVRAYTQGRVLAYARKATEDIAFKRGMHWRFDSLKDGKARVIDSSMMAPAYAEKIGAKQKIKRVAKRLLGRN